VKRGASNIHFECFEHDIRVRYRVDGALHGNHEAPLKMKAALVSALQDHVGAQTSPNAVYPGRTHQAQVGPERSSISGCPRADDLRRKDRAPNPGQGNLNARSRKFGIEKQSEKKD